MAEDVFGDSFPDLNELENKIGRKTPESLLIWMRDAAEGGDVLDGEDHKSAFCDSLCDKISSLRQEMRCLRSADVRILRQLVAVHEGIEAMRWLMEEKGALTSRGSSLTGSLSSLVTAEEQGSNLSPCRRTPSPVLPLDLTEITSEKPAADQKHATFVDPTLACSLGSLGSLGGSNVFESQQQDSGVARLQNIKSGAETIRRALLRSSRARRQLRVNSGSEKTPEKPAQETFTPVQQGKESSPAAETGLLGYDAQWCWVESQDDVTFL